MSKDNNSRRNIMPKNSNTKPVPENKTAAAPSFKSFVKILDTDGKPRGLKVAKNDVGGYTFTYGTKSKPVAVLATVDEMVAYGLSFIGLKLS